MGWFTEQVEARRQSDDKQLQEAYMDVASAILGAKLSESLKKEEVCESSIEAILKYYHYEIKKDDKEKKFNDVEEQIDYYTRPFGIMHRTVKLDKGWYKSAFGAFIGTLKDEDRVIALVPGKISGYKYFDVETGRYIKINRKNCDLISEDAICFYKPLPQKKLSVLDLLKFMFSILSTSDIIVYILMILISTLLGMISPAITRILFSDVVNSSSLRALISMAIFMVCFNICRLMFNAFNSLISERIGIKQNIIVQAAVMSRMISLPVNFFREYSSGELSQRSAYVQRLCSILMSTIMSTGLTSVFSLVYIGQIFVYAKSLVVPSIVITLSTIIVSSITTIVQMKITKKQMILSTKESGQSYAMITGIQKIKLAGAEKRMFSRWAKLYAQSTRLQNNPPALVKYSSAITMAISLFGNLVIYYLAFINQVTVADYYAFNAAYGMVAGAFASLASVTTIVADFKPTLEMAKPILEAEPEISESKEIVTSISGAIELNNVSFRYSDSQPMIIDDLSLKIKPGEYLAIVGTTGCGKSTLLRLLLGFEKPLKGSIFYDKKNIEHVDIQSLRRKIGVVMQNGKLFQGDIFSNITISAPQLDMDGAWEAAKIASIDEDIKDMPMGMFTMISEGQGGISGGQKQRLMIARAVAPKPKILMFDEATSALDNITQKNVSEAIDSLNCTRIVIAHRLSTIRHCDRIIVLDKGKIIEDGTYDELIKNNGFFASLVERQRIDVETK